VNRLAKLSRETHFRFAIATMLVAFHVVMFAYAAHDRLDIPFNSAPGEPPAFSDPNAPLLTVRPPRQPHHWSRLAVSRWDAQNQIAFALRGIGSCPRDPKAATDVQYVDCGLASFPAYGMTAGSIADLTGAGADTVLVLLSILCALIANLLWTHPIIVDRIGRGPAWAALLAFNLYPTAFFMVTPYPDAAVVALGLGTFLCVARDRWLYAGLLAGAGTLFAPSAVGISLGLGAAALASALRRRDEKEARWWRPLLAVPVCLWGVALTFLVYRIVLGDAFVFFRAQSVFSAGRDGSLHSLIESSFWLKGVTSENVPMVGILGCAAILIIVARELRKAFKIDELMLLGVGAGMVILRELSAIASHGGGYWQLGRYVLSCPIVFLAAGLLARKHRAVFVWWLVICFGIYWHVELCSYLSQGDPRVCPCLGHYEAYMPWQS
jgi:hypothetical protein